MPRFKSPKSLKNLCLIHVATDIKGFKSQIVNERIIIPLTLFEDLFQTTKKLSLLTRSTMEFFIQPEMQYLDSMNFGNDTCEVFLTTSTICKNLTKLELCDISNVSSECFLTLIQSIPKIVNLCICNSLSCNDIVLAEIGKCCSKLKSLNLSGCTKIKDKGIELLCIDEITNTSRNLKLEALIIISTNISKEGALIALKNLPKLKTFSYMEINHLFQILKKEVGENFPEGVSPFLELKILTCVTYPDEDLKTAAALCPNIQVLNVFASNKYLNELTLFKNLKTLDIIGYKDSSFLPKFDVVIPVFLNMKSSLSILIVEVFDLINTDFIDFCFPNLRLLVVCNCTFIESDKISYKNKWKSECPFKYLNNLHLSFERFTIPSKVLFNFLSQLNNLQVMTINHCKALTDKFIEDLIQSDLLPILKCFHMSNCNSISTFGIMWLIKNKSSLNGIHISKCKNIGKDELDMISKYIEIGNLHIQLCNNTSNFHLLY